MGDDNIEHRLDGSRADRKHRRERVPVPVLLIRGEGVRTSGGLVDISIAGVRVSVDHPPMEGEEVTVKIDKFRLFAKGAILRIYPTSIGYDVGIKFHEEHPELTARLLEYKVRSLRP